MLPNYVSLFPTLFQGLKVCLLQRMSSPFDLMFTEFEMQNPKFVQLIEPLPQEGQ